MVRRRLSSAEKWRRKNPEKAAAHTAVTAALRAGVLVKPLRCEDCGDQRRLSGHHADYEKPLDVVWICGWCHFKRHAEERGFGHALDRERPVRRYDIPPHVPKALREKRPRRQPYRKPWSVGKAKEERVPRCLILTVAGTRCSRLGRLRLGHTPVCGLHHALNQRGHTLTLAAR